MNQKKAEYIALYSLVFGVILVFGILIRQFVLSKCIDDFSSTVAFFATLAAFQEVITLPRWSPLFLVPSEPPDPRTPKRGK